jgi:uncharacterized integral membrane protein
MSDSDEIRRADKIGKPDSGRKFTAGQIGMFVLIGIGVLFAVLNLDKTDIDLLFTTVSISVVFVIVISGLIGFGIGFLLHRHMEKND